MVGVVLLIMTSCFISNCWHYLSNKVRVTGFGVSVAQIATFSYTFLGYFGVDFHRQPHYCSDMITSGSMNVDCAVVRGLV